MAQAIPVPGNLIKSARKLVTELGSLDAAAQRIGIARESLLRSMAGVPVRAGTVALIRAFFAERDALPPRAATRFPSAAPPSADAAHATA